MTAALPQKQGIFARLFSRNHSEDGGGRQQVKSSSASLPYGYLMQSYVHQVGKPVWMSREFSRFADEGYIRNVIAHRAIAMIAEGAASVGFKLFREQGNTRREVKKHPVITLLNMPNPSQAHAEFFESVYSYRLISGNAYLQSVGSKGEAPSELYALRPDRVAVIAGKGGIPAGYRYSVGEHYTDFPVDRLTGQSRILHLKTFHPLDDWYGLSPIEAAAYSIDQHNQSGAWNQALLQNGARPSGALVVKMSENSPGTLSEEQYYRIKQQIDEQFTGATHAGRPMLLEGGMEWREMSISPRDMDFVNAKHSSARDIALAFGVPPQLLGIPGDNTYSNLAEARLALWEQTIIPLVQHTCDALNAWLIPQFAGGLKLVCDVDSVSALSIRREALWARAQNATFLTDAEKRALVGLGGEI